MDNQRQENSIESHHQHLVIDTLMAGAFAGFVRDSLLHPIEVYQFARHLDLKIKLSTLTKGAVPAVIGAIPGAAAFITTYSSMKVNLSPYVSHERQYVVHILSAFAAEVMALLFKVPVDNIKKRHLTLSNQVSTFGITKRMKRSTGIGAFYKGLPPAVLTRITTSLLCLPLWEQFMDKVKGIKQVQDLTPFHISMCGAIAAGVAGGLTTPLHVAKTHFVLEEIREMEKEMTEKRELKRLAKEREKKHIIEEQQHVSKVEKIMRTVIKTQLKTHRQMQKFNNLILDLYDKKGFYGLYTGSLARTAQITLGGFLFFYAYAFVMEQLEDIDRRAVPCTEREASSSRDVSKCSPSHESKLAKVIRKMRWEMEPVDDRPRREDSSHERTVEKPRHMHPHSHTSRPDRERTPPEVQPEEKASETSGPWGWFSRPTKPDDATTPTTQRSPTEPRGEDGGLQTTSLDDQTRRRSEPEMDKPGEKETKLVTDEDKRQPTGWFGQDWFSKDTKKPSGEEDVKRLEREETVTDGAEEQQQLQDKRRTEQTPSGRDAPKTDVDDYLEIARNTAVWLFEKLSQSQTEQKEDLEAVKKREESLRRRTTMTHHDYEEHEHKHVEVHEEPPPEEAPTDNPAWFSIGWVFGEKKQPVEDKDSKQSSGGSVGEESESEPEPEEDSNGEPQDK